MTDLLNHWRKMYENKYLGCWDLCGGDGRYREVTAQIRDIRWEMITGEGGRKERKLVMYLQGSKGPIPTPMILSKPNGKTLESMFGADPHKWIGKSITLYALDKRVQGGLAKVLTVRGTKAAKAMRDELDQQREPEPDARAPAFDDDDGTDPVDTNDASSFTAEEDERAKRDGRL